MPIRRVVRATCAATLLGSMAAGIPGQGMLWIASHVLGFCVAIFLAWASTRAGYRKPGFVLAAAALPAWVLLLLEDANISTLTYGAAMLVGVGSCIVHYQSDRTLSGRPETVRSSRGEHRRPDRQQ